MTDSLVLSEAQAVIGRQWSQSQDPERRRLLELARDALLFILDMGQRYPFEDFRKGLEAGASSSVGETAASTSPQEQAGFRERLSRTQEFFTKLLAAPESAEERGLIQVILDTLCFISTDGQITAFGKYLEYVAAGGPPYAVASFGTREETEAWLQKHSHPPDSANVLIANVYHAVIYDRATERRRLLRNRDLEYYLAERGRGALPVTTASFSNRDEAEAWLWAQPNPAPWAWVSIAGERYLAASYPNLGHRALFPMSLADGYEVKSGELEER